MKSSDDFYLESVLVLAIRVSDASVPFALLRALSIHLDGFRAGGSAPASVFSLMLSTMGKDFNFPLCRLFGPHADGEHWLVFRL